ncbi:hypothetical protein RRU01S_03_00890 [Agrobacterium rubi TR3 = NBRC 13261]|uniref:Uncharacterized protein n=1 Tax=Agrobacterium rubi TR3 = NBRC 13261 TaxID=1368415 RepID=A0A081CQH5_9HYPH|nr:hypothetical protein [Agrobacterium rubi]MBP1877276.1 hypothetical protein [Agrobacterium rubi]GAK68921.1 hypothetical protein RRU01S_03_00890 [Agrobacterium rubi TR3 = NBRC 13261]
MADFVAVIRKAVDGLANNTPENRVKVYDKARSAVVRQLENMKPRPPEELLKRQILKLDTAIAEVEGEYSEALPAIEDDEDDFDVAAVPVAAPPAPDVSSPYYEETVAEEQRVHEEEPAPEEPQHYAPVEPAPVAYETYHEEPKAEERYVEPVEEYVHREPEAPTYFTTATEEARYTPEPEAEPAPVTVDDEDHAHHNWVGQDTPEEERYAHQTEEPAHQPVEDLHQEPVHHADDRDVFHKNTPQPYDASYSAPSPYYQDVATDEPRADQRNDDVHFGEAPAFADDDNRYPDQKNDAQKQSPAVVEDYSTYFQDTSLDLTAKNGPSLPRADEDPFAPQAGKKDDKERTPWDDLEDLIGYDGTSSTNAGNATKSDFDSGISADGIPASAYRTKKKQKRNYAGMVLGLCGVVLLAGGAYALWVNRDTLNDMVGGLVQSAQTGTSTTSTPSTETASAPANTPATTTPPAQTGTTGQQPAASGTPPIDDGSVTGTKFTQRLLADGTEKDEGAGPGANGQPATAEGQSVYQQTEAAPEAGAQTPPAAAGTATPPAGQAAPAQQAAAAASGHRMFLYEEVLGQTVPTAIEGTVSWSLQNEADAEGKPSSTVQGQITIPGRGLSALITFKRNTDPSLPASHLVEIVFSVGPGFEGGAIDSVQRIAMKSTEQDRGNALIAVPAKITDDFHMIALNDFPDALKTNLELMRTRDWIDIPVSYRNGRRALLTLQKGADGKAAFDTALREWSAAAPATNQ